MAVGAFIQCVKSEARRVKVWSRLTVVFLALLGCVFDGGVVCGADVVVFNLIRSSGDGGRSPAARYKMSPAIRSGIKEVEDELCHAEGVKVEDSAQIVERCEGMK